MSDREIVLETREVSKYFGGVKAVDRVSLSVRKREILSLIGPNGAGKTTLFNVICGFLPAEEGHVFFHGHKITKLKAYQRTRLGLGRTFQEVRIFKSLNVLENVMAARYCHSNSSVWDYLFMARSDVEEKRRAMELLELLGLSSYRHDVAADLPFGLKKRLEIARSLATEPLVLLLDEPVSGMNPAEKGEMMETISQIRISGMTILLVEHDMSMVMEISDRIAVMHFGRKIAEGTPEEVQRDDSVIEAYLGKK